MMFLLGQSFPQFSLISSHKLAIGYDVSALILGPSSGWISKENSNGFSNIGKRKKKKKLEDWWKPETRLMQERIDIELLPVTCHFQLCKWVLCFVIVWHSKPINYKVVVDHFSLSVKGNFGQYNCNMYTGQSCNRQCTRTTAVPTILHVGHLNVIFNFQTCWTQSEEDLQVSNQAVSLKHMLFPSDGVTLKYQYHLDAKSFHSTYWGYHDRVRVAN